MNGQCHGQPSGSMSHLRSVDDNQTSLVHLCQWNIIDNPNCSFFVWKRHYRSHSVFMKLARRKPSTQTHVQIACTANMCVLSRGGMSVLFQHYRYGSH